MTEEKKDVLLRQGNPLTESRYKFSNYEKNAFYVVVKQVRRDYVEREPPRTEFENMRVKIPKSALSEIGDEDHTKEARQALRNLRNKTIEFEDEEGNWLYCGFINQAKYIAKEKVYEVEVSRDLMPYLVELSRHYTEYSLLVAISLKSTYSQRFYELCCQYRNMGKFGKTIDQLRTMFMLEDKYPLLPLFKKRVIEVAQKELKAAYDENQCDLWFDYVQDGRGEKAHFEFFVHTRENQRKQKEAADEVLKEYRGILTFLRATIKKDPKYIERVSKHTQNIAHELKTPVASIQGYLETILDNPHINEEMKSQFLQRCYAQSERLTSLLRDISTLNRLDDGSDMIDFEAVDITQMVSEIAHETALERESHKMTFENLLPDQHIIVKGNRSLLYSVFRNLTDNAIAYAGEGRKITLSAKDQGNKWHFIFCDNGQGVPAEHLSRLFERFYRVDKGRSRKMGGTGLGLAIVKNAVLLHGGTIRVSNQLEGGLKFEFTLKK